MPQLSRTRNIALRFPILFTRSTTPQLRCDARVSCGGIVRSPAPSGPRSAKSLPDYRTTELVVEPPDSPPAVSTDDSPPHGTSRPARAPLPHDSPDVTMGTSAARLTDN